MDYKDAALKIKGYCRESNGNKKLSLNKTNESVAEEFVFSAPNPLSEKEISEINQQTDKKLPESFLYFLKEAGTCSIFKNSYGLGIHFLPLQEIKQQMIELNNQIKEDEKLENKEMEGSVFIIGIHDSLGEWMGFDLSNSSPSNFTVLNHEIPSVYWKEDAHWMSFENWLIKTVESNGTDTL